MLHIMASGKRKLNQQQDTTTTEELGSFWTKLDILLSYDPAISLLGMCLNDVKTYAYTKTCT